MQTPIGIWTRRETGAEIRVCILGEKTGYEGERRLVVCKETSPNPMYQFNVRADEVRLA